MKLVKFPEKLEPAICLEHQDMIEIVANIKGVSESKADKSLRDAKLKKTKGYGFATDPLDRRKTLYIYNDLKDPFKKGVKAWLRKRVGCKHEDDLHCDCGNPGTYLMVQPIRDSFKMDDKAFDYFMAYRYNGPKGETALPFESVEKYSMAAGIFNEVNTCLCDKKGLIKRRFNIDVTQYLSIVLDICKELIQRDKLSGKFPTTYQRFITAAKQYSEEGYNFLLPASLGNQAAAKVLQNDLSSDILLSLLEHPNQYDDVMVTYLYNKWAKENNYALISAATAGVWRRKYMHELMISREGNSAFNERFIKEVKGFRPRMPLSLVECDDYNLNYYYINPDAAGNKDMHRYVSYVVVDSSYDLVLGKCYRQADSPTFDMIRLAWIDAMYYIKSITGAKQWYLPFEVKADAWQKDLTHPYFSKIAKIVPAGHGNKHRGYIEQFFGSPHAKRAEKIAANNQLNYNGNNVTAINWGVNVEALQLARKNRPIVGLEAEQQIENYFHYLRNMPAFTRNNMLAASKQEQWLKAWNELSDAEKRPISDEQFLSIFGFSHNPGGRTIKITNRGVEPQIGNVKYSYDLPNNDLLLQYNGADVTVVYDPYDMSRVLITNYNDIRFVAYAANLQPRALADATIGSREALNRVLADKKEIVNKVTERADQRKARVQSIDVEAVMLEGLVPKELKNNIEQSYLEYSQGGHYDPLEQM